MRKIIIEFVLKSVRGCEIHTISELFSKSKFSDKFYFTDFSIEIHKMIEEGLIKAVRIKNNKTGLIDLYVYSTDNDIHEVNADKKYCIRYDMFYYYGQDDKSAVLFTTDKKSALFGNYSAMLKIANEKFLNLSVSIVGFED